MPYRQIQMETMRPAEHMHVPAIGGLDQVTPKSFVPPGSLSDCMNYEVDEELGYSQVSGLFRWSGKTVADVKRWFEADSTLVGPATFRRGGIYTVESVITGDTAKIKILDITDAGKVKFQVISGDWFRSVYEQFDVTLGAGQEDFITSDDDEFQVLRV